MQKTDSFQSPDRFSCIDYETPSENDEEESPIRKSSSSAAGVVVSRKNDSPPKSPASTISIHSSIDYQTQSDDEQPEPSPIRKQSTPTHKSPPSDRISQYFSSIPTNSSINSLKPPYSSSNRMTKEDRIRFTRLLLRRQDLKNLYTLSRSSLKLWLRKADNIAHDNADLQSVNRDLKDELISSIANDFRPTIIRDNNRVAPSCEADSVTSPTSVIGNINQGFEENSVQFQPERASLPTSISVRSSSYVKMNGGRNTTAPPFDRITGRHRANAGSSPTSVIGNINQGFEENSVQFQPERASLPMSISVRSSSYFKMNAGRNTTAPPFNRVTSKLRPDATPFVPRSLRVHMPTTVSAVDDQKKKKDPVELDACVQGMYKTELCDKWVQRSGCPYGDQCQFAHGIGELRPVIRHPRYKTEVCRGVLNGGSCTYGRRCHFRHVLTDQEKLAAGIV